MNQRQRKLVKRQRGRVAIAVIRRRSTVNHSSWFDSGGIYVGVDCSSGPDRTAIMTIDGKDVSAMVRFHTKTGWSIPHMSQPDIYARPMVELP